MGQKSKRFLNPTLTNSSACPIFLQPASPRITVDQQHHSEAKAARKMTAVINDFIFQQVQFYQFYKSSLSDCLQKYNSQPFESNLLTVAIWGHRVPERAQNWRRYISHRANIIFNIFLIIQYSQMSEQEPHAADQSKKEAKANNRWTNISSDEDQSESEHSQKQQQAVVKPKPEEKVEVQPEVAKEEVKKKEPNIVPFDPKKKFRGEFANIKTVKGGFKAEKLEQKKFRLDTVKNPFQVDDQSSEEEKQEEKAAEEVVQEPKQQQQAPVEQPKQTEQKAKKTKKTKKQQEKEQLQALLKQLNVETENKGEEGEKKKKKKKAKKDKVEGQQQPKEEPKPQEVKPEPQPTQQQAVNRQAIEEVMRKKAEAAKTAGKKAVKATVASNARKAIQQREAKNKQKKVYVDL